MSRVIAFLAGCAIGYLLAQPKQDDDDWFDEWPTDFEPVAPEIWMNN